MLLLVAVTLLTVPACAHELEVDPAGGTLSQVHAVHGGVEAWYTAYKSSCLSYTPWSDTLANYSAFHARALAILRRGDAEEIASQDPPLALTVYRIPRRHSVIGVGCLLPGLANAFLSSLARGRVFLLDWVATEGVLDSPPGLDLRAPWRPLAQALGAGATTSHQWLVEKWVEQPGSGGTLTSAHTTAWKGVRAPALWGEVAASDPVDIETYKIFNRGVFTHLGATLPSEHAWLARVLPRSSSPPAPSPSSSSTTTTATSLAGPLAFGCVYAASVPLSPAVLRHAGGVSPPLPPLSPLPPSRPPSSHRSPPPLVCLHVRTWALEPSPPAFTPTTSPYVHAAFQCLDHVLQSLAPKGKGGKKGGKKGTTTSNATLPMVYVASDDATVRTLARARFGEGGGGYVVLAGDEAPAQSAFIGDEDGDEAALGVHLSTWAEWVRLAHCPILITSAYSGYGRSAGGAGWESALYFYDDEAAEGVEQPRGRPCKRRAGVDREFTKGFGAGW